MLNRTVRSVFFPIIVLITALTVSIALPSAATKPVHPSNLERLEAEARLLATLETLQHVVHSNPSTNIWANALQESRTAYEQFTQAGLSNPSFPNIIALLKKIVQIQSIDTAVYGQPCQIPAPPDPCIERFVRDVLNGISGDSPQPFHEQVIEAKHFMTQGQQSLEAYQAHLVYRIATQIDASIGLALDELTDTAPSP